MYVLTGGQKHKAGVSLFNLVLSGQPFWERCRVCSALILSTPLPWWDSTSLFIVEEMNFVLNSQGAQISSARLGLNYSIFLPGVASYEESSWHPEQTECTQNKPPPSSQLTSCNWAVLFTGQVKWDAGERHPPSEVWPVTGRGSSRLAAQPPVQLAAGSSLLAAEIKLCHKVSFSLSPGSTQPRLRFPPKFRGWMWWEEKKPHKRIKPVGRNSAAWMLPLWA